MASKLKKALKKIGKAATVAGDWLFSDEGFKKQKISKRKFRIS